MFALGENADDPDQLWSTMPESTRLEVLALFARLITRGVVETDVETVATTDEERR
jgi:hypothetical protein